MGNKGSSNTSAPATTPAVPPPTNESSTTLTSEANSSTATLIPKPATQPATAPPARDWDAAYGALAKSIGFGATAPTLPVKVKKVKKDSSQGGGESSGASRA